MFTPFMYNYNPHICCNYTLSKGLGPTGGGVGVAKNMSGTKMAAFSMPQSSGLLISNKARKAYVNRTGWILKSVAVEIFCHCGAFRALHGEKKIADRSDLLKPEIRSGVYRHLISWTVSVYNQLYNFLLMFVIRLHLRK